jgi:hypothetical protein
VGGLYSHISSVAEGSPSAFLGPSQYKSTRLLDIVWTRIAATQDRHPSPPASGTRITKRDKNRSDPTDTPTEQRLKPAASVVLKLGISRSLTQAQPRCTPNPHSFDSSRPRWAPWLAPGYSGRYTDPSIGTSTHPSATCLARQIPAGFTGTLDV